MSDDLQPAQSQAWRRRELVGPETAHGGVSAALRLNTDCESPLTNYYGTANREANIDSPRGIRAALKKPAWGDDEGFED